MSEEKKMPNGWVAQCSLTIQMETIIEELNEALAA
jgi:hypothetical protein